MNGVTGTGNLDFEVGFTDMQIDLCETKIIAKTKVTMEAGKNITLENNFFSAMFSHGALRINGNSFQIADFPDITDSKMRYIILPKDYTETEGLLQVGLLTLIVEVL